MKSWVQVPPSRPKPLNNRNMLGKPKFKYGDLIEFRFGSETKTGKVYIIDKYGTFFDDSDVSYDIMVESENILYKHIREDFCSVPSI